MPCSARSFRPKTALDAAIAALGNRAAVERAALFGPDPAALNPRPGSCRERSARLDLASEASDAGPQASRYVFGPGSSAFDAQAAAPALTGGSIPAAA
jgi:hypothetical protein